MDKFGHFFLNSKKEYFFQFNFEILSSLAKSSRFRFLYSSNLIQTLKNGQSKLYTIWESYANKKNKKDNSER